MASTSTALQPFTGEQISAGAKLYRTLRMGTVSIREQGTGYSVIAPRTSIREESGRIRATGARQTRYYPTGDAVAVVVAMQAHEATAALSAGKPAASLPAPRHSAPRQHRAPRALAAAKH